MRGYSTESTMKRKEVNVFVIVAILIVIVIIFVGIGTRESHTYAPMKGNKSTPQEMSNISSKCEALDNKYVHLSIDDAILVFKDITENKENYTSIFENKTLKYLRELYIEYGVVTSCYVYYELDEFFNLSDCTDKFATEFTENSNWLRFGFHTINGTSNYESTSAEMIVDHYNNVISELYRITGNYDCIDNVVRLQNFAGNIESIKAITDVEQGIIGLLSADDERKSYYLDDSENDFIYENDRYYDEVNDLYFISTDLRMEMVSSIDEKIHEFSTPLWNKQLDELIIFTHEWALDEIVKNNINKLVEYAKENGYQFPEDTIDYKNK